MLVALASATAIAILLPAGPDDGCPSPRQVSDAVSAHLPGVVLPLGRAPGPSALRLSVTSDATGTLRVDLSDPEGGALLRRRVAPETAAPSKAAGCVALAETAALIVDRYWHEVGYEVPAAPAPVPPKPPPPPAPVEPQPPATAAAPPTREAAAPAAEPEAVERRRPERAPERPSQPSRPPDWWIALGSAGQAGDRGPPHVSVSLAVAVERAALGRRLGLRFSVAGRNPNVRTWGMPVAVGKATVVQVPVAIDAYLTFPVGLGRLEPGIGVDLNVIIATGSDSESGLAAAPAADALLGWTIPLPHDTFLRARAAGAVGVPYQVVNDHPHLPNDASRLLIIETPRLRAELGLELGVSFY